MKSIFLKIVDCILAVVPPLNGMNFLTPYSPDLLSESS